MKTTVDKLQLKRAWQTAFEVRLCPGAETLFAEIPDENLNRHLQVCHLCREKREMPSSQRAAWQELLLHFAGSRQRPARPLHPVPGQVWSLQDGLAGWGADGYFHKPPRVLLVEQIEGTRGFKAVQLYSDRLLMGEGDVWIDERFGFAQGWNCYSLHEESLDCCWGAVSDVVLAQVAMAVSLKPAPVEEDSILYFFRRMETAEGARFAAPSVAVLLEEWEAATEQAVAQELLKGLVVAVTEAGQTVVSMVYQALRDLRNAAALGGDAAMEPARSQAAPPENIRSGTGASEAIEALRAKDVPFIPIDVFVADDSIYIELFRFGSDNVPRVAVTCNSEPIDDSRVMVESWNSTHPKIVIKNLCLSTSKLRKAEQLFRISSGENGVVLEIMPE